MKCIYGISQKNFSSFQGLLWQYNASTITCFSAIQRL